MDRTLDPARLGDHLDRLYRAAWAFCGSREEAEDLVHETYVRLLSRPRCEHRSPSHQPSWYERGEAHAAAARYVGS